MYCVSGRSGFVAKVVCRSMCRLLIAGAILQADLEERHEGLLKQLEDTSRRQHVGGSFIAHAR